MADKNPVVNQPPIRIGCYLLGETLGIGSFGKVKSEYIVEWTCWQFENKLFQPLFTS